MVVYNCYYWYKQLCCFVFFSSILKPCVWNNHVVAFYICYMTCQTKTMIPSAFLAGDQEIIEPATFFVLFSQLLRAVERWNCGSTNSCSFLPGPFPPPWDGGLNLLRCSAGMLAWVWGVIGMFTCRSSNGQLSSHAIKLGGSCRSLPGSLQGKLFDRAIVTALFSWLRENWFPQKNIWYF